ncbi:hypothetical protein [Nocardioides montaniterrae]
MKLAVPSLGTVTLAARVTVAALRPVVTRADLTALQHLPFVLTHLDDAAVVAAAVGDPVGTTVRAPGAALRLGVMGARVPGRVVGRALHR